MEEMNKPGKEAAIECPSIDIAAYIDGELTPDGELKLESHIACCRVCMDELNLQKHFVNALNLSLQDTPELPNDFTKRIVTTAESNVRGLRRRRERLDAMFITAGLGLFVLFTLGAKAPGALSTAASTVGGLIAVIDVATHALYDFSVGVVVILRSLAGQPVLAPIALISFVAVMTGVLYKFCQTRNVQPKLDQAESGSGY
jgi:anti-sigma factor RsiW